MGKGLDERDKKILLALAGREARTTSEIAKEIEERRETVSRHLGRMDGRYVTPTFKDRRQAWTQLSSAKQDATRQQEDPGDRDRAETLRAINMFAETIIAIGELVENRRVREGDGWLQFTEDEFFDRGDPYFNTMITSLISQSLVMSEMLRSKKPTDSTGVASKSKMIKQEHKRWYDGLASAIRKLASTLFDVLAPPPIPPYEEAWTVFDLQREFRRFQLLVEDGWMTKEDARAELSHEFAKAIEQMKAEI